MLFFLIGFMGSGKTTVGKKLSKKLNFDFIDLDTYIENYAKMNIATIFKTGGENKFREIETVCLQEVIAKTTKHTILSCGGGTPCYNNNIQLMKTNGTIILLKMNAKSLANRLQHSKEKRPIIEEISQEKLVSFIETKLLEREQYYNEANIAINAESIEIAVLTEQINSLL